MPELQNSHDLVLIGAVVASHGLQGTVRVEPLTDFPERFLSLKTCFLRTRDDQLTSVTIKRCKLAPNGALITFDGIRTREAADLLRGATLEIPMSERWGLPENAFYISDMIGCDAFDEAGNRVGTLTDVLRGAQDILTLQTAQGEILVPFVNEWVGDVNLEQKRIVIRRFNELVSAEEIPPAVGEGDH